VLALEAALPGVGETLQHLDDPEQHGSLIGLLSDLVLMDVESYVLERGAVLDALHTLLVERTTLEERRSLVEHILAQRPTAEWQRRSYDHRHRDLVLSLAHGVLDDDAYLALCRDFEASDALMDELLRLGRPDDAVAALRTVPNPLLYERIFDTRGQSDRYYTTLRDLPSAASDPQLLTWLRDHAEARGDLEDALTLGHRAFDRLPSTVTYCSLRAIATRLGRWEPLRQALFERERKAAHWPLVAEIDLEDGDLDDALEALAHVTLGHQDPLYSSPLTVRLKVAAAAESARPDAAITIYVAAVDYILTFRGRSYYARAAELLSRVRDLYRQQGQGNVWQSLITRYREQYRRLSALQDELAKAKLFDREPAPRRSQPSVPAVGLSVAPAELPPQEAQQHINVVRAPGSPYAG
jgi:tetratricopeptide (TPR) repeat protein